MIDKHDLLLWCRVAPIELENHSELKVPFKLVEDSASMGELMARELVEVIENNNQQDKPTRAIIPCGPKCWYEPFRRFVNAERVSLKKLTVFHMDECLDWQGKLLPEAHPYNFKTFMLEHFYGGIPEELAVPQAQRFFPDGRNTELILEEIAKAQIDITIGGWGQDGHVAYNQARRHPFSSLTIEELRNSSLRVQDNNIDTILTLAQRTFGAAYQFVPPMSVTLGIKECLSAKRVRVYSDTGTWKQTALRVALFSDIDVEYPMTLLQEHPDARITATFDTARHPVQENPDWELF